jgi:hypothetical protein
MRMPVPLSAALISILLYVHDSCRSAAKILHQTGGCTMSDQEIRYLQAREQEERLAAARAAHQS